MVRSSSLATALLASAACAHVAESSRAPSEFRVDAPASDRAAAEQVARVLPEAVRRAERWGHLDGPVTIRVHPTNGSLTAAAGRPQEPWLRGWARPGAVDVQSPRTWSRGWASDDAMTRLLAHELTHCVLFQILGTGWAGRDVPSWFEEGMASYTAGEIHDVGAAPAPGAAEGADPAVAYGVADRAFRTLVARHGENGIRAILDGLAARRGFPDAFEKATGQPAAGFERSFASRFGGATASR